MRSLNLFKQNTEHCEASPSFPINFPARTLAEHLLWRIQNKWSSRSCSTLHMLRNINVEEVHVSVPMPTSGKREKEEKPEQMLGAECGLRTNLRMVACSCYKWPLWLLRARLGIRKLAFSQRVVTAESGKWRMKPMKCKVKWKHKWRVKT